MRFGDRETVEHGADVVAGALLRIAGGILRHIGRRVAPGIESYTAIAPREVADLRFEAAIIVGEFVDENDRGPRTGLLVKEADAVIGSDVWHRGAFVAEAGLSYERRYAADKSGPAKSSRLPRRCQTLSENRSKGSSVTKSPCAAIEPVEHRQALVSAMGNNQCKALPGAGRCGRSGRRHLLGSCTAGGSLGQARGCGGEPLAAREYEIINRLALFDFSVQSEPRTARFVDAGLLLSVRHAGGHRTKANRGASWRCLLGGRLGGRNGRRGKKAKGEANPDRGRAPHCQFLVSSNHRLIAPESAGP